MKQLFSFLSFMAILAAAAYVTKPTDAAIYKALREQLVSKNGALFQVVQDLAVNDCTVQIHDHLFYKEVYSTTGEYLGSAFLTQVNLQ